MVDIIYYPSTWETKAGGFQIQVQSELLGETVSKYQKEKKVEQNISSRLCRNIEKSNIKPQRRRSKNILLYFLLSFLNYFFLIIYCWLLEFFVLFCFFLFLSEGGQRVKESYGQFSVTFSFLILVIINNYNILVKTP
jgi:hypothetical protein